jgi:hypothetical protein
LPAWSQLDISVSSDLVFAVSEGNQFNYCWIIKLLKVPRIFKLLILCGNQLISPLDAFVFVPIREKFPRAEFGMISAKTPSWEIERKKPTF